MSRNNDKLIIGLGGIFFKATNPDILSKWYKENFGLYSRFEKDADAPLATLEWKDKDTLEPHHTVFGMFENSSKYFEPSRKDFMFNFIVNNLEEAIEKLKSRGIEVWENIDSFPYGRLAYLTDPDGNKIELWEPNNIANI